MSQHVEKGKGEETRRWSVGLEEASRDPDLDQLVHELSCRAHQGVGGQSQWGSEDLVEARTTLHRGPT